MEKPGETIYWLCVAHIWQVPPTACCERGEGDSGAEKHSKATGHPTITTRWLRLADDLACEE